MFAIMKRILDLAGSFSPASRRSLMAGMVCNVIKAFFMSGMLIAVWWALEMRSHLSAGVALQCLGILAISVAGQFAFQYLVDIQMDAEGFHIFRDLRLRVGDRLKGAPMGYFSEQRLSAITTTLTTTCTNSKSSYHLSHGTLGRRSYGSDHESVLSVSSATGCLHYLCRHCRRPYCFGLAEKTLDRRHTGGHCRTGGND